MTSVDFNLDLDNSITNGFQLACSSGPLCEEPMMGVCFIVENLEFKTKTVMNQSAQQSHGPFSGQAMSTMKEACRQGTYYLLYSFTCRCIYFSIVS